MQPALNEAVAAVVMVVVVVVTTAEVAVAAMIVVAVVVVMTAEAVAVVADKLDYLQHAISKPAEFSRLAFFVFLSSAVVEILALLARMPKSVIII
jgi:hypothetical protein